jgi:hypothetical protein
MALELFLKAGGGILALKFAADPPETSGKRGCCTDPFRISIIVCLCLSHDQICALEGYPPC